MRRQAASEGRGRGSARARAVNGVLKSRRCAHSPPVLHANGIRRRGRDAGGDILAPRRRNRQLGLAGLAILELRRAPRHGGAATRAHHREGRGAAPVDLNDDARGLQPSRPTRASSISGFRRSTTRRRPRAGKQQASERRSRCADDPTRASSSFAASASASGVLSHVASLTLTHYPLPPPLPRPPPPPPPPRREGVPFFVP